MSDENIHIICLAIHNRAYNHANILNLLGLPLQESSGAQSKSAPGFRVGIWVLLSTCLADRVPQIFGPWAVSAELAKCVNKHWRSCYNLAELLFVHLIKLGFTPLKYFCMPPIQNSQCLEGQLGQHFLYLLWKNTVVSHINTLIQKEYLKKYGYCARKAEEKSSVLVLLWCFFFFLKIFQGIALEQNLPLSLGMSCFPLRLQRY